MLGYGNNFITTAFDKDPVSADLIYFHRGIHVVMGTVGSLADDVFAGKYNVPFVLRSEAGDMAVGGLKVKTDNMTKKYVVSAVLSQIERNRDNRKRTTLNPVFSDPDGRNFLVLTAVELEPGSELTPLEDAEAFVQDWISGYPGVYL